MIYLQPPFRNNRYLAFMKVSEFWSNRSLFRLRVLGPLLTEMRDWGWYDLPEISAREYDVT